jgi:thioredoxin 1
MNANETAKGNVITVGDQNFVSNVLNSQLPVIVDFWGEWCPPCRVLAPLYEKLSNEYVGKVRFAKLNVDEHISVPASLHVQAAPTLILFADGKEVARVVGPHPVRLKDTIDRLLAQRITV